MKTIGLLSALIAISILHAVAQPLKVSKNGHFLETPDGAPFFWLADTGWELYHRLNREEAQQYIETRARQGYNVIQAVALFEREIGSPNDYGDYALKNMNPEQFDTTAGNDASDPVQYDYWDHVEYMISLAASLGIHTGLLPCWGEYVTPRFREPTIKTPESGYRFGHFFGSRFKKYNNNIIWILGGDRLPNETHNGLAIWRAIAEGITDAVNGDDRFDGKADYRTTFMTFHCYRSSSEWFHSDPWLDMHTWGSYHEKRDNERAYFMAPADWALSKPKPTLNSEPAYESGAVNYDSEHAAWGWFDDFDVRQSAYWSVFSGACGHTYGNNAIWQMHKKKNLNEETKHNKKEWHEALNEPGAVQMIHLKNLMLSRPFESRRPAQDVLASQPHDHTGRMIATAGPGYAMVYLPTGRTVEINGKALSMSHFNAWWYNPRDGRAERIGSFANDKPIHTFDPPGDPQRGNDLVLVLDDVTKSFAEPGK